MLRRLLGRGSDEAPKAAPALEDGSWLSEAPDQARRVRTGDWEAYLAARGRAMTALRSRDARAASKALVESRRLHAKWRGYPYNGPDVAEVAFPSALLVDGVSNANEARAVFAANRVDLIASHRVGRVVAAITFGDQLSWPDFDRWRAFFVRQGYQPAMWSEALLAPEPAPVADDTQLRALWASLAPGELFALAVDAGSAIRLDFLAEHACLSLPETRAMVVGLATRGLATFPAAPADHLAAAMTVEQLRTLAQERGITVRGRKSAIAATLAGAISPAEIAARAPGEFAALAPIPVTPLWEYRIAFADLLAHSLLLGGLREGHSMAPTDVASGYEIGLTDDCPACRQYEGKKLSEKDGKALPPYLVHPGCRCTLLPIVKGFEHIR